MAAYFSLRRFDFWLVSFLALAFVLMAVCNAQKSAEDYLGLGNAALMEDANARAIDLYEQGIASLALQQLGSKERQDSTSTSTSTSSSTLVTRVSLETNLATAYSAIEGMRDSAYEHYEAAIRAYYDYKSSTSETEGKRNQGKAETETPDLDDARSIVSQAAFFYGMELQDHNARKATEMYGNAVRLDPELWAAWANLGSVFQDHLNNYDEALLAYNQAYEVLTEHDAPTDPPAEPTFILSQLQYRIGTCLSHSAPHRKCSTTTDPTTEVSCTEMATHAFSKAVQYDSQNMSAKHMLASLTADATMKKASNEYVKGLFDEYAQNFEQSLVNELGYDGYARLRRAFDRGIMASTNTNTKSSSNSSSSTVFAKVLDAGCGTGLVGEQFRNVSSHLIGVDLSEAILDEAEKLRPKLYDERIVGDVTEVIRSKKPLSMVVAADSFIYFGDLDPLFESIHDGLETGGYLAFTLENVGTEDESILAESKPDWRWQLTASGRFAHRKEYVAAVGQRHGLHLVHYEPMEGFRHELGKDVRGHAFLMKKEDGGNKADGEL